MLSLQETRERLDLGPDDATLAALIAAATVHVETFLGHGYARHAQPPEVVRAAVALAVADMLLDPEAAPAAFSENKTFAGLLTPYRQPDLAGAT